MVKEDMEWLQGNVFIIDIFPWLLKILPNFVIQEFIGVKHIKERMREFCTYCDVSHFLLLLSQIECVNN